MKNRIMASLPFVFWFLLISFSLLWNIRHLETSLASQNNFMLFHVVVLVLGIAIIRVFRRSRGKQMQLESEMSRALERARTADILAEQVAVHKGFSKTAQYLAGLTAQQDLWSELAKAMISFFGANIVAFGERDRSGEISFHHWTPHKDARFVETVTGEIREDVTDVLESGFLAMRSVLVPEPCAMVFLPMTHGNQTTAVVAVGHNQAMPLPEESINVYLSIAGLAGTMLARLRAERALLEAHEQLENRVKERTTELSQANENLKREITERKRMEEELIKAKKLEATGILAGGIAHDFNNLLSVILLHINLVMDNVEPGSSAFESLCEVEKAVSRATDLTKKFITFSSGGSPLKRPASIRKLIEDCSSLALSNSSVECRHSFTVDLRLTDVDPSLINQVIYNVIVNAKEAMPEGGIIDILAENMEIDSDGSGMPLQAGPYVRIAVRDSGVGIPRENLGKVFDPYYSTKDRGIQKGMGLGLTIAYSIIRKHGGLITVESETGTGTTFSIYLPAHY